MIDVVGSDAPPPLLLLGEDAVTAFRLVLDAEPAQLQACQSTSHSPRHSTRAPATTRPLGYQTPLPQCRKPVRASRPPSSPTGAPPARGHATTHDRRAADAPADSARGGPRGRAGAAGARRAATGACPPSFGPAAPPALTAAPRRREHPLRNGLPDPPTMLEASSPSSNGGDGVAPRGSRQPALMGTRGTTRIDDGVVEMVAGIAAREVAGVRTM